MEAEGETPLSREEWEKVDVDEVPSYEEYLKIVKDLGDDSVEVVEKDVWDDFSDDDKVELVKTLKLSKIGGNEPVTPDKEVEVKVGKDQTYADAAAKADEKFSFHVRRIAIVSDFRHRNAFMDKVRANGLDFTYDELENGDVDDDEILRYFSAARTADEEGSIHQDDLSEYSTWKEAEDALRNLLVKDIQNHGLVAEKIFEYTPDELLEIDPDALGFRYTGVVGKGEKKSEARGGVKTGKAGRAGVKDGGSAYEDRYTFQDAVDFMKTVYELAGQKDVSKEKIEENILNAARKQDFWYTDGFQRMRTFQYYLYYSKGAYEAKGMDKETIGKVIDNLMKDDTLKKVTDETKGVNEACGKSN